MEMKRMIGSTVSLIGGIKKGIGRAREQGYQCTQIYTTNSRRWEINQVDRPQIKQYAIQESVVLVAHVPFLVNLASSSAEVRSRSQIRLKQEIECAHSCGINTIVLHPGSATDGCINTGIRHIVNSLDSVADLCSRLNVSIALETMSGQGTQIGSSIEELSDIFGRVRTTQSLSLCIDTAHLYAAGYDIKDVQGLNRVFECIDRQIGLNKISVFHLNNTPTSLGGKTDRHSSIFGGNISLNTFSSLVSDNRFCYIPKIIEPTAKDETASEQVRYLQAIISGGVL